MKVIVPIALSLVATLIAVVVSRLIVRYAGRTDGTTLTGLPEPG